MQLESGSRLGPYEIIAHLGAGGMGEVYRARDTRVGREVAVKILPLSFASNEQKLKRFQQEARAAAALNHPNLLTIHDVGAVDGIPYIVCELLEGESLRERLSARLAEGGSPIPPRKAIEWASAVATGLAAAHDKGIVHRDLKPDNVFITTDGRVKILDFGLAKLTSTFREAASDEETAQQVTAPGTVMGTAGYMSPEQVRGQNTDHRTDVFSLGAMLYEMLSGHRAFRGSSAADTMSAILHEDPPTLVGGGLEIPSGLERIVRRCLEKNPEERFHSAHDVALALEAISDSSVRPEPGYSTYDRLARRWVPLAVIGAIALLLAAFFAGRLSSRSANEPSDHISANELARSSRLVQLTSLTGSESQPAISPDGTSFLYLAPSGNANDIFLQRVGGSNPINLTRSPEDEQCGAFSPDGTRIAFCREGIWVMGATGESVRRLTDFGYHAAWDADGESIVFSTRWNLDPRTRTGNSELWRVDLGTGETKKIEVGADAIHPSCSPDGRWIAFWGVERGASRRVIYVVPAEGGDPVELTDDDFINWSPVWVPDGRSIIFASDRGGRMNLWQMPVDPTTGAPAGKPWRLTTSANWNGPVTVARTGEIAFSSTSWTWMIERTPVDLQRRDLGTSAPVMTRTTVLRNLDVSPDGKWLVVKIEDPQEDLVVFSIGEPSQQVRLTSDPFRDRMPRWSGTGDRIFFFSDRSGRVDCWSVRADGSGLQQETRGNFIAPTPSPDGDRFFALRATSLGFEQEWCLFDRSVNIESREAKAFPVIDSVIRFVPGLWSSDGKKIFGRSLPTDGSDDRVFSYTLATRSYEELLRRESVGSFLGMGPREKSIITIREDFVLELIDFDKKESRELGSLPSYHPQIASMSRDGTALFSISRGEQSDVWMLAPVTR